MQELDLPKLDRDIARAARAARRWLRLLRSDAEAAAEQPWFESARYVTTRSTFAAVSELSSDDPLRDPLVRWVHRLALTRIVGPFLLDAARAWQKSAIELDVPERGTFSAREIVRRAISDREPERVRAWLEGLSHQAPAILLAEKQAREAEFEITTRLGVTDRSSIDLCDRDRVRSQGERFLAQTADLASSIGGSHQDLAALLSVLVARGVPGVWPTRIDERWLSDLFGATPLLEGLVLDLGRMPAPLGSSSFARGLARFGAAYARAAAAAGAAWFVRISDPTELHPLRRGALLSSLLADPVFLRRKMGFSRDAARETARSLAVVGLSALRLSAAQTTLDFALAAPGAIEEATSDALRVRVDQGLSGAFPRPDGCASERLLAALLANDDRVTLRDRFDEDWFANPNALRYLREVDADARPPPPATAWLEGSSDRLARTFDALAG